LNGFGWQMSFVVPKWATSTLGIEGGQPGIMYGGRDRIRLAGTKIKCWLALGFYRFIRHNGLAI